MRTNFYELLAKSSFDFSKEFKTLWNLFMVENCVPICGYLRSLATAVDREYFRRLPFRGSFTNLAEMMSALDINQYVKTVDDLFLFCEFLIAVLPKKETHNNSHMREQRDTILGNINHILERTNHEIVTDPNGNSIIVERNKAATLAAQLADNDIIAFELIEYNHFALKGDLEGKKKLLFSVAAYIEPILKSRILQQNGYRQLESDAGFLFNKFHIRHNNKEGINAQPYIKEVSDTNLEEWYDKAYEIALSVIIINDYIAIGKDIANIKSEYTWKD